MTEANLDPALTGVLAALAAAPDAPARLISMDEEHVLLRLVEHNAILLALTASMVDSPPQRAALQQAISQFAVRRVHLLVVEPTQGVDQALRELREQVARPDVQIATLSRDGTLTRLSRSALPDDVADRISQLGTSALSHEDASAVVERAHTLGQQTIEAHNEFVSRMQSGVPRVTALLCGSLTLSTLCGWYLSPPNTLLEASALWPKDLAGSPWAVISYATQHANGLHLGMNMWVLWMLGGQLERILGGARVSLVFFLGVLGGGLAVSLFGSGPTVGASGGIWALLVAQGWLAYLTKGVLPESVAAAVRRYARQNLLINTFLSFLPMVSMAGHLGGGLGAVIAGALGLLGGSGRSGQTLDLKPRQLNHLAALCWLLLFGSLVVAYQTLSADETAPEHPIIPDAVE